MSGRESLNGAAEPGAVEAEDIVQDVWLRWQVTDRSVVLNFTEESIAPTLAGSSFWSAQTYEACETRILLSSSSDRNQPRLEALLITNRDEGIALGGTAGRQEAGG